LNMRSLTDQLQRPLFFLQEFIDICCINNHRASETSEKI
jgi:hypothetical protein